MWPFGRHLAYFPNVKKRQQGISLSFLSSAAVTHLYDVARNVYIPAHSWKLIMQGACREIKCYKLQLSLRLKCNAGDVLQLSSETTNGLQHCVA
jgi:NMD protein affecting ribosome stability and mRNA decay